MRISGLNLNIRKRNLQNEVTATNTPNVTKIDHRLDGFWRAFISANEAIDQHGHNNSL